MVAVILSRSNTWVTVILGNAPANLGNAGLPLALTDTAHPHLFTHWLEVGYNGKAGGGEAGQEMGLFCLQLPHPDPDSLIIICNTRAHHLLLIVSVKHPLDLLWPPLYRLSDNLIHL